jgi:hypothetical protein
VKYIIKTTFLVPRRDGRWHPAYVRHAGNVGNNFLFNLWRVDSESDPRDAASGESTAVWRAMPHCRVLAGCEENRIQEKASFHVANRRRAGRHDGLL